MKKILFVFLAMFVFINMVKANEWQEEILNGENVETEYRYRFYKDKIEGEYVRVGVDTDYQYEEEGGVYGEYSSYQSSCPSGEGYEVEYATKYVYQEILPVQYIKINNLSEQDLTIKNIEVRENDKLVSYEHFWCNMCSNDRNTINPGGTLMIKFEHSLRLKDLTFMLEFTDVEDEVMYELVYSANSRYSAADLVALKQGNTNIVSYKYDDSFYLYPNYSSIYTGYNIMVDDLIKIKSLEDVCRVREIMTYRYNVIKDYYDDNYYKDILELTDLAEEERFEYKKDLEDYKVFYRYKETDEELSFNEIPDNNFISNDLKLVKTGIYDKKVNYKYLIVYVLVLVLISLILLKYIRIMSNENDD